MRVDKVMVIARREYITRVKTKGFWLGTILLPVFILAVTLVPALVMSKTKTGHHMAVVDETGTVGNALNQRLM
jgi:ABC-2 type transport system permease protein